MLRGRSKENRGGERRRTEEKGDKYLFALSNERGTGEGPEDL